ncbi:MAG: class I SAM-dependent methyltransferase [Methanobacterium paludis]|nr:class I SAM-dependent methyltransferase [Methanobacterium paludis]
MLTIFTILLIIFLAVILFVLWVLWTFIVGAGWQPASMKVVKKMLDMAEVNSGDVVYDLGSGDGRIVITTARKYHARAVGIEVDPLRVLWSVLVVTVLRLRKDVKIVWSNFFHQNLTHATVVTLFLWHGTNQQLKQKFLEELKPGTRVVSYYWTLEEWKPVKVDKKEQIYMYIIGQSN